jgi:hypothetical protein
MKRKRLTRRFESTVYTSGDWYIRLLMMKYAARGRTKHLGVTVRKDHKVMAFGRLTFVWGKSLSFLDDEQGRWYGLDDSKFHAGEPPGRQL